ncbi:MAG: amidophosphoribosyltransferase [Phycisphaerae bacterium]|nr:amidophosphoribosyltransferase [Phycisphaerae bacterium]
MNREVRHYCGLFGIAGHPNAAHLTLLGMYALQHRGQESAGICVADGQHVTRIAGMGLVTDAIDQRELEKLRGPMAIGHVRYSTTGSCSESNVQPLIVRCSIGQVAICHNGNLVNAAEIRRQHEEHGHIFITTSDTEVILHMLADRDFASQPDPLAAVLRHLTGSYCLLLAYPDRIEAVRDPSGNRPLCLGRKGEAWLVASETCALDMVDAEYVRDVEPGEIVTLTPQGMQSRRFVDQSQIRRGYCIFEHVYFADPSSLVFGENVHLVRKEMGRALAREAPADADLVIPVPNCARCAAMGFHEQSGIPVGRGFTTNHYVGRSFIQPTQYIRDLTVRMKLNPIRAVVVGKRLVVVEDSIVRGTTTRGKMASLRKAGAKEIHLRVASPPIRHPCYYGIDFPSREELVAHARTIEEIRDYLEVDSLAYLSLEGMLAAAKTGNGDFCHACFSGEYPIPIDPTFQKDIFERRQLRFELVANDKNGASLPVLPPGPAQPKRPCS